MARVLSLNAIVCAYLFLSFGLAILVAPGAKNGIWFSCVFCMAYSPMYVLSIAALRGSLEASELAPKLVACGLSLLLAAPLVYAAVVIVVLSAS